MKNYKKYLFWFANEHIDFRLAEIESIGSLLKTSIKWSEKPSGYPYGIAELPSEDVAKQIARRSVTLKHITELWAQSSQLDDLHIQLKQYVESTLIHDEKLKRAPFKFDVELYCNTQSYTQKLEKIESFNYLPICGPVNLNNPELILQYYEYYGKDPNNVPEKPYFYFFGRQVAKSQRKSIYELSLKNRKFIGNTSMDAELSLIMANCAKVSQGDLVYDPFVGTGSLLVAAAYNGGYVFGVDIDFLMIHGRTKPTRIQNRCEARKGENVRENLKQYGLEDHYIDVVVGDSSLPLWTSRLVLDAIITDPPYGIREATERIGSYRQRNSTKWNNEKRDGEIRFPSKIIYSLHMILEDLLKFAGLHLKIGGRLTTWIPVFRDDYKEKDYIPSHACFSLVSNCEQVLSRAVCRRLLTFEKVKHPQAGDLCSFNISNDFREKYLQYRYGLAAKKEHVQ